MAGSLSTAEVLVKWQQTGLSQVQAGTKTLGASFDAIAKKATAAGKAMSIGVTAPLVLLGKAAVTNASDLAEAQSAVDQVFGASSATISKFAQDSARNLGVSKQAALQSATQFGSLFKGIGLGDAQMSTFTTGIQQAAADLGSFNNIDPTVMLDKLRSGLVGQSEPLRSVGILITETAVKAKGMQLGLADANGELSEGAKVQARYALIMEQLGVAQGDFARTSGGLANSERILQATMTNLSATLGQVLLPYVQQGVALVQKLVDRFQAMNPESQKMAVTIGLVAAALGPALLIFGQFAGALSSLSPLMAALTGPLGLVALAVGALFIAWRENWFGIRDITQGVVDKIGPFIARVEEFFTHAKDRGLDPFRLAMRALIVPLTELVGAGNPVVMMLTGILRNGEKLGDWLKNTGIPGFKDFGAALKVGDIQGAGDAFGKLFEDVKGGWDTHIVPLLDDVKTFGQDLLDKMLEGIRGIKWEQVGEAVQAGLSALSKGGAWILDALKGIGASGGGGATNLGAEFLSWIKEQITGADWPAIGTALLDGIGRAVVLFLDFTKWRMEKLTEFAAFLIEQFRAVNWADVGSAVQAGMVTALDVLGHLKDWIIAKLGTVDWGGIKESLTTKATEFAGGLAIGAQNGLTALGEFARWILEKLGEVDWESISSTLATKGQEFITGLLTGIQAKSTEVMTWFNTLGSQIDGWITDAATWLVEKGKAFLQGLLDGAVAKLIDVATWFHNLPTSIVAALPSVEELGTLLYDQGGAILDGFWNGAKSKWQDILDWFSGLQMPSLPSLSNPFDSGDGQPTQAQLDAAHKRVNSAGWGGNLATGSPYQKTMVGEYGPELVLLPPGAMVMPHGASQARLAASRGMALGGVVRRWPSWDQLSESHRQRLRSGDGEWERFSRRRFEEYQAAMAAETGSRVRGRTRVVSDGFVPWDQLSSRRQQRFIDSDAPWERLSPKRFAAYQAAAGMAQGGTVQAASKLPATGGFGKSGADAAFAAAFREWLSHQSAKMKHAVSAMQSTGSMTTDIRAGLMQGQYVLSQYTGKIVTKAQEQALDRQAKNAAAAAAAEQARRAKAAQDAALSARSANEKRAAQAQVEAASRMGDAERIRRGRAQPGVPSIRDESGALVVDPNRGQRPSGLTANPISAIPATDRAAEMRRIANSLGRGPNEMKREMGFWNDTTLTGITKRIPAINPDFVIGTPEFTTARDKALRYLWRALSKEGDRSDEVRRGMVRGLLDIDVETGEIGPRLVQAEDGTYVPATFYGQSRRRKRRPGAAMGRVITVGEYGPEAVILPNGAMVQPHGAAQERLRNEQGASGGGLNFYGSVTFVMKSADIASEIAAQLESRNR